MADLSHHKVILFLDSFDESRIKSNIVVKFLGKLGNKIDNKIIITCRTGYVDDDEMDSLFMPRSNNYEKVYIARMKQGRVKEYINKYVKLQNT